VASRPGLVRTAFLLCGDADEAHDLTHGAYQSTTVVCTSHFGYSVSGSGSVRSSEVGSPQPTHS
jgi:hypothetical protein